MTSAHQIHKEECWDSLGQTDGPTVIPSSGRTPARSSLRSRPAGLTTTWLLVPSEQDPSQNTHHALLPTFWASVGISSLDELSSLSFRDSRVIGAPALVLAGPLPTEKGLFPGSSSDDRALSLRFPASSLSFLLSFSSSFWAPWASCKAREGTWTQTGAGAQVEGSPAPPRLTSSPGVIFSSRRLSRFSMADMRLLSSFI